MENKIEGRNAVLEALRAGQIICSGGMPGRTGENHYPGSKKR